MYSDELMDVVYESIGINEGILDIFKKKKPDPVDPNLIIKYRQTIKKINTKIL